MSLASVGSVAVVVAEKEGGIEAFRTCNAPSAVLDSAGVSPKTPKGKVAHCHLVFHATSHRYVALPASTSRDWWS